MALALSEPPDFGDLDQPGPVFGAPLEKQTPSPDYPVSDFSQVCLDCLHATLVKNYLIQFDKVMNAKFGKKANGIVYASDSARNSTCVTSVRFLAYTPGRHPFHASQFSRTH